jgi:hypothetical protein
MNQGIWETWHEPMEQFIEALLALAGAFIVYYWLTIGDLGKTIKGFF